MEDFGKSMVFELDEINSPDYGNGINLKCDLEYVLAPGIYKLSSALKDPKRLNKIVQEIVSISRDLYPDLLDEEVLVKVTDYAKATALLNPSDKMELEHPRMKTMIMFYCFHYALDDAQDELCSSTGGKSVWTYKEFPNWFKTYCEDLCEAYAQIPAINSQIASIQKYGILFAENIYSSVADFKTKDKAGFEQESFWAFSSNIIEGDLKAAGKNFSMTTNFDLDRYVSAVRALFEFMALFHDVVIDPIARRDLYFHIAFNSYANILSYYNAILGFQRDVKLKQETGPLMHLIIDQKLSLEEAFKNIESQLKFAYNDYRIATENLLEVYGEERVGPAIRLMGYIIDGSLYAYKVGERYGTMDKLKIVKE